MKITRRQLRKLIQEITIKPGGDLYNYDPEGKIEALATSDDVMNRNMADAMADSFGYEGSYSSDLDHYYNDPVRIMIQQELDDLSVMVGPPENRFERKILTIDSITEYVAEYFENVVAKEPNYAFQEMMQKGYSFEDIVENITDYMIGMMDLPEKFYKEDYSLKDNYAKEIKRRFAQGLRNVLEYEY
jgi:hypothetical protein